MSTRTTCLSILLLLAVLVGSSFAELVAHYKLDGDTDDSVGENHGLPFGDPTYGPGTFGQAMRFDGINDYIAIPPFKYTNDAGEFAVSLWFKIGAIPPKSENAYMLLSHGTTNRNNNISIYFRSDERDLRTHTRLMNPASPTDVTGANGLLWACDLPATGLVDGEWHMYTLTSSAADGGTICIDGQVAGTNPQYKGNLVNLVNDIYFGRRFDNTRFFGSPGDEGLMDDLRIYNHALTQEEVQRIMVAATASGPNPENRAIDIPRDVVLGWTPGASARTHDVYFGTFFADVNVADRADPLGVLVSQGQVETTYDPPGLLDFGQSYFWRVDEIEQNGTIHTGDVWSFTVEPYSYPIAAITAMASSSDAADMGPEKTVDGSGLSGDDQHSTLAEDMWLSGRDGPQPAWIQYAFDKPYKLHEMWVWNSNQRVEAALGCGAKSVAVQYSADGSNWAILGDFEFAQAPGQATYAHNTTIDLAGAAAKHVKLTINSNWNVSGTLGQYGLSEVRFLAIPVSAREPSPAVGAMDIAPTATLNWRAGREAQTHDVYIGLDPGALALAATVAEPQYEAQLNLGATYYWSVVEVNKAGNPSAWKGDVWSFSTQQYLTVDDFETYTNASPNRVFQAWIDGAGFSADEFFPNGNPGNGTGSLVGYDPVAGDIMEKTIVHGGRQSMPLYYDNTSSSRSETERTFASAQNWTRAGVKTLTLYVRGDPNNSGQMYVKINGTKVIYDGLAEDIKTAQWQRWDIDLTSVGVNLQAITKLGIGVDGASGILYVDDIRLYP